MHIFEREVNGHRYRIAAQSVWDAERGRSVARQVVLGPAEPPPLADLRATHTVGTRGVGDVGALIWVAEQLDLVAHIDRACGGVGAKGGPSVGELAVAVAIQRACAPGSCRCPVRAFRGRARVRHDELRYAHRHADAGRAGPAWTSQEQEKGPPGGRAWRPGRRDGARAAVVSEEAGPRLEPGGARGMPGWVGAAARGTRQRWGSRATGAAYAGTRRWVLEPATGA